MLLLFWKIQNKRSISQNKRVFSKIREAFLKIREAFLKIREAFLKIREKYIQILFCLTQNKISEKVGRRKYIYIHISTVALIYNRRFISVFFWILFRKIFSPALCYIWEIGKPYALDNYNT